MEDKIVKEFEEYFKTLQELEDQKVSRVIIGHSILDKPSLWASFLRGYLKGQAQGFSDATTKTTQIE